MSDLISRSALIEKTNDYISHTDERNSEHYVCKRIKKIIEDAPTAYDLDKVVRELEEYIPQEIEMSHERYLQYLALDKAIEIVKRGGVK